MLFCFSAVMMAQAEEPVQQSQNAENDSIKGVHPYKVEENEKGIKPEIAHWSIIPHIGFSAFDGDFTSEMKHNVAIPTLGLVVEYNFTPVWNVGVEYMYDMYTVTGKTDNELKEYNADTLLTGHMHKAGAYVSFDIINLFFPRVKKKIFSMFLAPKDDGVSSSGDVLIVEAMLPDSDGQYVDVPVAVGDWSPVFFRGLKAGGIDLSDVDVYVAPIKEITL